MDTFKRKDLDKCDGCQKSRAEHLEELLSDEEWDSDKCTQIDTTDSFSYSKRLLKFNGFNKKNAKVKIMFKSNIYKTEVEILPNII